MKKYRHIVFTVVIVGVVFFLVNNKLMFVSTLSQIFHVSSIITYSLTQSPMSHFALIDTHFSTSAQHKNFYMLTLYQFTFFFMHILKMHKKQVDGNLIISLSTVVEFVSHAPQVEKKAVNNQPLAYVCITLNALIWFNFLDVHL